MNKSLRQSEGSGSMSTMTTGPWLKWAYRYYSLTVEEFDTLDDALAASWYASELGNEAFDSIEGPEGVVPKAIVEDDWARREEIEATHYQTLARRVTYRVILRTLDGKETVVVGWYASEVNALAQAARLSVTYGDRVSVDTPKP